MDWFQIGKAVCQSCMLSPSLFNLYAEYIMQNTWLNKAQARIKIAERNINNFRYTDDTTLMEESKEELKSFLMKVKEESEKAGLKLNIQKSKIIWSHYFMANRWGKNGNSDRLDFFVSKLTVDGEIKRHLLLGRKAMTNLDSVLKVETSLCQQRAI